MYVKCESPTGLLLLGTAQPGSCRHTQPCQLGRRIHSPVEHVHATVVFCLPSVHQAQLALVVLDPMHLPAGSQCDVVRAPAMPQSSFPVPLSQQMWCFTAEAGLPCLTAASLTPTLRASSPLVYTCVRRTQGCSIHTHRVCTSSLLLSVTGRHIAHANKGMHLILARTCI